MSGAGIIPHENPAAIEERQQFRDARWSDYTGFAKAAPFLELRPVAKNLNRVIEGAEFRNQTLEMFQRPDAERSRRATMHHHVNLPLPARSQNRRTRGEIQSQRLAQHTPLFIPMLG